MLHLCAGATLKLVEYGKAPNNKTLFIGCKNKNQSDIVIAVSYTHLGNFDFNLFFNYSLGNKLVNGTKLANSFYACLLYTS